MYLVPDFKSQGSVFRVQGNRISGVGIRGQVPLPMNPQIPHLYGSGFRVNRFGFRVSGISGFDFRISGFWFREQVPLPITPQIPHIPGSGFLVSGIRTSGFMDPDCGFRGSGTDPTAGRSPHSACIGVSGFGFGVSGFRFRVSDFVVSDFMVSDFRVQGLLCLGFRVYFGF